MCFTFQNADKCFMTIICFLFMQKKVSLSVKFPLHKIWVSAAEMLRCLNCVMIGLSCKWSLTFHYTSRLSSLMATAPPPPPSCYIRAVYSGLVWLAHSETRLEGEVKVWGRRCWGSLHISSSAVGGLVASVRGDEGLNFSSAKQPECNSCHLVSEQTSL